MHPTSATHPLRAYGDREGDGMVQMSFTLAVPPSARAREAARRFAEMHGLREPLVATMEECADVALVARDQLGVHLERRIGVLDPVVFLVAGAQAAQDLQRLGGAGRPPDGVARRRGPAAPLPVRLGLAPPSPLGLSWIRSSV